MAELQQRQASVPARWRFFFAAALPFLFFIAALILSRPGPIPLRDAAADAGREFRNARIRLQTAAIAFSSGKLDPHFAIVTDRPGIYAPEQNPVPVPEGVPAPVFWVRMTDSGVELRTNCPLPREFRPLPGFPVIVDPRDRKEWEVFLDGKCCPGQFDMILLDCAFPARVASAGIAPWTSQTFAMIARSRAMAGTVFAVVLPQDRPHAAVCAMTAMKNVFGNVGTFRFGERTVAASSVPMSAVSASGKPGFFRKRTSPEDGETLSPIFSLEDLSKNAALAGYYATGDVPDEAIFHILNQDYSEAPPAWLLEGVRKNRERFGRDAVGPLAYARAELLPHLRKLLPAGLPYGVICAWTLGIGVLVYMLLRYFISWKPVHKQSFLAFEDMFLFTGSLSLFCMALPDVLSAPGPGWIMFATLSVSCGGGFLLSFRWPTRIRRRRTRVVYLLIACACYALAFWLRRTAVPLLVAQLIVTLLFMAPVGIISDLVQTRIQEPVQPGTAIPLAFILGVIVSLAVFAAGLFFPAGPAVFAALICGFRLAFLDN